MSSADLSDPNIVKYFEEYADLYLDKRDLTSRLDEVKDKMKAMQPALLACLASSGLQSLTIKNLTIFPQREPWIYPLTGISRQQVCEALKIAGLGYMVKENYSTPSLTAHIKQLEEHHKLIVGLEESDTESALRQLLHPALAEIVHVQAAYSLHVRKKDDPYAKSQKHKAYNNEGDDDE